MKKTTTNRKPFRFAAAGLATLVAVTSVPVITLADEAQQIPEEAQKVILVETSITKTDTSDPVTDPGVSQAVDIAQAAVEHAEGTTDPSKGVQKDLSTAETEIGNTYNDLETAKKAMMDAASLDGEAYTALNGLTSPDGTYLIPEIVRIGEDLLSIFSLMASSISLISISSSQIRRMVCCSSIDFIFMAEPMEQRAASRILIALSRP